MSTTARELAHAHLGTCEAEHTKACDMLTVEVGHLFREVNDLREGMERARRQRDEAVGLAREAAVLLDEWHEHQRLGGDVWFRANGATSLASKSVAFAYNTRKALNTTIVTTP